jgi:FHA domain-containing protein
VSRLQAEVTFSAGGYSLRNVGGSNPIIVNGRPLGPGEGVALRHQDQLMMGSYQLHVELQSAAARPSPASVRRVVDPRTVIGASAHEERTGPPREPAVPPPLPSSREADPFADLLGMPGIPAKDDPFADLMAPAAAPRSAPPRHSAVQPAVSASPLLPDDFDPFADPAVEPRNSRPARPEAADTQLQDLLGPGASTPGISTMFGLKGTGPSRADPMADFLTSAELAPRAGPGEGDPFAFLHEGIASKSGPQGPASADHTPELRAAFKPPPIRSATPAPAAKAAPAPVQPAAPSKSGALEEALWAAFCEGAEVTLPSAQRLTPELMRLIGSTLRDAVDGTVQLNMMRATVKQELHVPGTMIQPRGNNPLKFAPDATAALVQMLQPPMRGFMPAGEAMQDAMNDLIGHSLGTMEGTRAALHGVLDRFEPARLEAQLAGGGMLDRLVPMNRRARLWELYLQHYERIIESAREDFDELFGKAFAKAYQEHAERVTSSRRSDR